MGLDKTLFLTNELSENIYLSSRNLADVLVLETQRIDPYSLLYYNKVILTKDAVVQLEEQLV
ncbi:MAG: 50S ribosomal protein L4, partial [Neisseriaceae bacterium]|nr:50S ribosomal protein L4 [Neisseriaceae bacterium]